MKNNKIRRWATVLCCLEIFGLSSYSWEGRWKTLNTSGLLMAYWEQFVFKTLPNSSRISPKDPRNNLWQPRSLPVCLVSTLHVFCILMIHVGWLEGGCYKLFPERFHHDSQDRIYNAIKVTCYQVAHADPLPTSLATLPRALSLCHKQALLQRRAAGISSIFLQAIKKSSVSPKQIIIFWYFPGRLCSQALSLPRVFQKSACHTRALNNVSSVLLIFIALQTCPFLPVLFQKNFSSLVYFSLVQNTKHVCNYCHYCCWVPY